MSIFFEILLYVSQNNENNTIIEQVQKDILLNLLSTYEELSTKSLNELREENIVINKNEK
jgi:hypothetical protein